MKARFRRLASVIARVRRALFPPKNYVVIYDELDEAGDPKTEEYYGYFATPAEARELWASFNQGNDRLGNVKLCRVVESWEQN